MKSVTHLIKDLTGESYSDFNFDSLGRRFAKDMVRQERKDAAIEYDRYNPSVDTDHINRVKAAVGKLIAEEKTAIDAKLPVAPVFDAYQIVKGAVKVASRDIGLINLSTHLEKIWKKDRQASLTYEDFEGLKRHYKKNFPKSAANEVLNDMVKNGYTDLPMVELMNIAACIRTQEDFEHHITANGLASNSPRNKKARQFILAAVNSKNAQTKEMFDAPEFQKGEGQELRENIEFSTPEGESSKPIVESVEKNVNTTSGYSGMDGTLDEFNSAPLSEIMGGSQVTVAEAVEYLEEVLEFDLDELEDNRDVIMGTYSSKDLYEALSNTDLEHMGEYTYNSGWWGPDMTYELFGNDIYGEGLVFIETGMGLYDPEIYAVDNGYEDIPVHGTMLTFNIKTDQGEIWIDAEDNEAYNFYVHQDETGIWSEGESIDYDEVNEKLSWKSEGGGPYDLWASRKAQSFYDDDYDDENFSESDPEYLVDSWINGNRKHVIEVIGDDLQLLTQVRDALPPDQQGVFDRLSKQGRKASRKGKGARNRFFGGKASQIAESNDDVGGGSLDVDHEILQGMIDVFWGDAWASFWEELQNQYDDESIEEAIEELDLNLEIPSFSQMEITEIMDAPPKGAEKAIMKWYNEVQQDNGVILSEFIPPGYDEDFDRDRFGNALAFEGMGSGVSWTDEGGEDHGLKLPYAEGGYVGGVELAYESPELEQLGNYMYETYVSSDEEYEESNK